MNLKKEVFLKKEKNNNSPSESGERVIGQERLEDVKEENVENNEAKKMV